MNGVTRVDNEQRMEKANAGSPSENAAAGERRGFKSRSRNASVTARVESKLLANGNIGGMAIDVDSKHGVVILSGTVGSQEERELAVRLASNTIGAFSVTDYLVVKPNPVATCQFVEYLANSEHEE